jgi:hypothetical protein
MAVSWITTEKCIWLLRGLLKKSLKNKYGCFVRASVVGEGEIIVGITERSNFVILWDSLGFFGILGIIVEFLEF